MSIRLSRLAVVLTLLLSLQLAAEPAGAEVNALSGTVVKAYNTSEPLPWVQVYVVDYESGVPVASTTGDGNGLYAVPTLPTGHYYVYVYTYSHTGRRAEITYTGTPLTVDFELGSSICIAEGTVRDSVSHAPIAGAAVNVYYHYVASGTYMWVVQTNTGADGTYSAWSENLGKLGPGNHRFDVQALGYADESVVIDWSGASTALLDFDMTAREFTQVEISGASRYDTAIAASRMAFPVDGSCSSAVIASGANYPDALGASALAGALSCPVLLTPPASLPASVAAEVVRLGATDIKLVGGTSAVSLDVEQALKAISGVTVERISGASRYETAARVAVEMWENYNAGYTGTVMFATGQNFPDALAAAPLAAADPTPILLVKQDEIPDATIDALDTIMPNYGIVLGGESAIGEDVYGFLEEGFGYENIIRLAGNSRYETAAMIAEFGCAEYGLEWDGVAFATGTNFPDALAGGAAQGIMGSPVLLTKPDSLEPAPRQMLLDYAEEIFTVRYLGGLGALGLGARAQIQDILAP